MASVLFDIESDRIGSKEDSKKIEMEAEDKRKNKYEHNQMRDENDSLKGIYTCEVLVHSVSAFGMDHINKLKVKELRVILIYHFESETFNGIPKKL